MTDSGYRPLRIEDLPRDLRPREVLKRVGSMHSSDDMLLSVILRVGVPGANAVDTSRRLLAAFGSLDCLACATYEEIVAKRIPGVGETKALQIVAAIELGRRCSYLELVKSEQRRDRHIQSSEDVYNLLMPLMYGNKQELFYVILLGPRNKVIGEPGEIAKGQRDEVALQPNLVFELALKECAKSIIVAHNHPSGDPVPSDGDVCITRKLIDAGRLVNVPVLDHLIVGMPTTEHSGFFSIAASGKKNRSVGSMPKRKKKIGRVRWCVPGWAIVCQSRATPARIGRWLHPC